MPALERKCAGKADGDRQCVERGDDDYVGEEEAGDQEGCHEFQRRQDERVGCEGKDCDEHACEDVEHQREDGCEQKACELQASDGAQH